MTKMIVMMALALVVMSTRASADTTLWTYDQTSKTMVRIHGTTFTFTYDPADGHVFTLAGQQKCSAPGASMRLMDTVNRVKSVEVTSGKPMVLTFVADNKSKTILRTVSKRGIGYDGAWFFESKMGMKSTLTVHVEPYSFCKDIDCHHQANELVFEVLQEYKGGSCVASWFVDDAHVDNHP